MAPFSFGMALLPNESTCAFAFLTMNDSIVEANAPSRPVLQFAGLVECPLFPLHFILTLETFYWRNLHSFLLHNHSISFVLSTEANI